MKSKWYNEKTLFVKKKMLITSSTSPFPSVFRTMSSMLLISLPNSKSLDWSKLKAFADDKINLNKKLELVLGRVENIVGKGENAGYQHFLLFQQCFQKASLLRSLKVGIVWYRALTGSSVRSISEW